MWSDRPNNKLRLLNKGKLNSCNYNEAVCIPCVCVCLCVVCGKEIWYNPEEVSIRQRCVRNCQESLFTGRFSLSGACTHKRIHTPLSSSLLRGNNLFSTGFLLFIQSQYTTLDLLIHSQVCKQEGYVPLSLLPGLKHFYIQTQIKQKAA